MITAFAIAIGFFTGFLTGVVVEYRYWVRRRTRKGRR
jgi:hypothetical protein